MTHPQPAAPTALLNSEHGADVYRLLAEQAGMVVYDRQPDCGRIVWSGATHALLGYTLEEFQQINLEQWTAMIHPEDRPATLTLLDQASHGAKPFNAVYRFLHKSGYHIHVHDRGSFMPLDGRRRMIGSLVDVSDSRLRAQALTGLLERVVGSPGRAFFEQLARELWHTLDATRVYVGRLSDDGDTMLPLAVCHRGEATVIDPFKLAGSPSAAVLHRGDGLFSCWGNIAEGLPAHASMFASWDINTYVGCALTTPTGYRIGVLSAMFTRPPARREAVIAILQLFAARAAAEIERRETEGALRTSEARFRSLSESSPVGVYHFDPQGNCIYVNKRWTEITGMSAKDALQKGWRERLPTDELQRLQTAWLTFTHGPGEFSHKLRFAHPSDGSTRWIQFHARRLFAPGGELGGFVGTIDDITTEMEAEAEIRRLNASLEERVAERTAQLAAANAELEAFSYSVSHDLRSPLRAIDGFSRAIAEDYEATLDDNGRDYLRRIREASQRMAQLIDDLLRLSRATRTQMRVDATDLAALAQDVVKDLRHADTPGRRVEFVCPDTLPARVDRDLMRIVLDNLLGNSWKYTRRQSQPKVEFSVASAPADGPDAGAAVYTVSDNGAGFDMKYAGKLFAPFQRLHTRAEFEGTGIGLATVRRIVTRHGGRVWAESSPGQGTRVHFTLKAPSAA
jgi:PAS domain S-box-containing protein